MKIGDRCFVHGYIDEIRKDIVIIRNNGGYFGTVPSEVVTGELPSAQPEQRWIPCDKGEPDEDMECWVTVKTTDALYRGNFTKRYGEWRDKGFITSGGFMWWNTALAWMPIYEPEPYRPEGDDKHEG